MLTTRKGVKAIRTGSGLCFPTNPLRAIACSRTPIELREIGLTTIKSLQDYTMKSDGFLPIWELVEYGVELTSSAGRGALGGLGQKLVRVSTLFTLFTPLFREPCTRSKNI